MPSSLSNDGRIRTEYLRAQREYTAYDRTLNALAAFSFVLQRVTEIAEETTIIDFRPKLVPVDLDCDSYTPDGHFVQRGAVDFVLELKASWNEQDIAQVIKYAKSQQYYLPNQGTKGFDRKRCLLLGYQNLPGEPNMDKLFDAWKSHSLVFPLVVFRYSLEQAPDGDRMFFMRSAYPQNGSCPQSALGRAINSVRGFPVSVNSYKSHRPKFHKASDGVIPSYAAVLWWSHYARYYLSEEQKIEMAEKGRLRSPLVIPLHRVPEVPIPAGVEVPLGSKDVRHALEFLTKAKLVSQKKRARAFEIELKEDRYIRVPQNSPVSSSASDADIATKILVRWATQKVKSDDERRNRKRTTKVKVMIKGRRRRDTGSGWLFSKSSLTSP